MELRDLGDNIFNFNNALESIEVKRKTWNERTKQLIIDCFIKIINAYGIGWEIRTAIIESAAI